MQGKDGRESAVYISFRSIEPVRKCELCGDVLHRFVGTGGQVGGPIFWEFKRIKNGSALHDTGRFRQGA